MYVSNDNTNYKAIKDITINCICKQNDYKLVNIILPIITLSA